MSTVGASRANGSSSYSAGIDHGRKVALLEQPADELLLSGDRPSPGPRASALARPTASQTSSSGRLTASTTSVSRIGSDSAGAAIAT